MTDLLSIANLLAWCAQVALLVGVALLALRLVRLEAPAVRHVFLRVLLVVCLVLPVVQPRLPSGGRLEGRVVTSSVAAAQGGAPIPASHQGDEFLSWLEVPWVPPLTVLLIAGVVARLAWIAAGVVRLRKLRRAGEVAPANGEHDDLQRVIGTRATIRYVGGLGQPVTFGFHHPVVLLPETLLMKPGPIQRAVLVHELWHVRRRDWMWTVAEEAVRAVLWFHPAIWILLSRIQSTREEVVDELTVLATGSRRSYLDALLAFADESPIFAATAFARRRHLVHRMVLISKEAVMSARHVVACGAVLAVVAGMTGWYGAQAFPLIQDPGASEILSDQIGPFEQRAKAITPENPVPRRIVYMPAEYPAEASAVGARGTVTVRATVDESGRVAEARAIGFSLKIGDGASISLSGGGTKAVERALNATFRPSPFRGTADQQREEFRELLTMVSSAAVRAVNGWAYAPPADGPLAFFVSVPIGPQDAFSSGAPPPPPPPPPGPGQFSEGTASWRLSDGAVRVGGNIKPPTKILNVSPIYPPVAQAARVQGVVILEARIEADGSVGQAHVLRSIPLLDEAALDAVRQWRFTPTLVNGQAVPVIMTTTVNFSLH
jgi:TonB family protein